MHPHLKSLLVKAGCDPTATDADAQSFYDAMSADGKSAIDSQLKQLMEDDDADDSDADDDDDDTDSLSAKSKAKPIAASAVLPAVDNDAIAITLEARRVEGIKKMAATIGEIPDELVRRCVGANMKVLDARTEFLKHVAESAKPIPGVKVGADRELASLAAAIPHALVLRATQCDPEHYRKVMARTHVGVKPEAMHERAPEIAGLSFKQIAQRYYAALGFSEVYEFSDAKLADLLGPRGMRKHLGPRAAALAESISDLGSITIDAQNKSLRFFYLDAKRTWPIWAEKKFNPDFKNINRIVLSEVPSMTARNEGGELIYGVLKDSNEVYALKEYVVGLRLTRRLLINDSLDALASVPRGQANAAARAEDDVAYAVLTANANMADGGALFNNTVITTTGGHANLTSPGAAPSVSTLQTAATSIKKQKGLNNAARLELEPKFLLVPTSIEESTKELIGSQKLIASQSSSGSVPVTVGDTNPFFNRYQVVGSTRLDDASATAWYLLSDYRDGQVNTVEICFLTDEPEPIIKQETDFDSDDVKMLCRHTVAAKAIDFRGVYKNAGA